jgi:hypothetical protein
MQFSPASCYVLSFTTKYSPPTPSIYVPSACGFVFGACELPRLFVSGYKSKKKSKNE